MTGSYIVSKTKKMKKEKRKSRDEHDGHLTAIVPANDAMVFEEVVATGHKGSSASVDDNIEQPDLRYIGWLLREKLNDLVDGDQRASRRAESKLRSLLSLAALRKMVSVDPKMMSPVLWRTLPQELLLRVLTHLPLPDITGLRSLSKEWNRNMVTVNSEINRACDEMSPIVVAGKWSKVVVVDKNGNGRSLVGIYDSGTRKWRQATPPPRSIVDLAHVWDFDTEDCCFRSRDPIRVVYDFAERLLKRYDEGLSEGASVIMHTHHQDCMFVLHRNTPKNDFLPVEGYCIAKYRIQNNAKDWIQERSHSLCSPLETLLEKDCDSMILKTCEDFVMVFTHPSGKCEHLWLLDLATGEWSTLPHSFRKRSLRVEY